MINSKLHADEEPGRIDMAPFLEELPRSVRATSEATRAERVIRSVGVNTSYQVGSQVAPAIAAMATIPFVLRHLGVEAFGIITLFSTALIYFTMLDLGLGRAAT